MKRMLWGRLFCVAVVGLGPAAVVRAWHGPGHDRASRLAVSVLPKETPAFFRGGADAIAHCSLDPDTFTRPIAPPELHGAEAPEHYFDVELLAGAEIPAQRYDLITWCVKKGIHPAKIGLLPYAVTEWTQRLTVALAEHRRWPGDELIRRKCLVYAGILAHYAEDLHQPLHTTIHYDGRARKDGSSPRTGIHLKVDALLGKLPDDVEVRIDPNAVQPFEKLFAAVAAELKASHSLVDPVYGLEKQLPAAADPLGRDGPVAAFVRERLNAAALFTARLYRTAWRDSAKVELPQWHRRKRRPKAPPGSSTRPGRAVRPIREARRHEELSYRQTPDAGLRREERHTAPTGGS